MTCPRKTGPLKNWSGMGEELINNRRKNHKIETIESFNDLYYFAYGDGDVYKSSWYSNLDNGTSSKSSNIPRIT